MAENLVLGLFALLPVGAAALWLAVVRLWRPVRPALRRAQVVAANLLGLVFLLTLLLLAGEVYFRFVYDSTDSLLYTKISRRWLDRYWHLNAAGCRDDVPYSYARVPGQRRITFVGDSFTAAHGVKQVADRFANRIRRDHPEWDIQVLAQLGHDTGNEIQMLERLFSLGYQADEVVLVYCLNDVSDLFPDWQQATRRIFGELERSGWLERNSYCVNTLCHRIKVSRDPYMSRYFEFVEAGYRGDMWRLQQERLKTIRDLVSAHGGRLSVVTFPFLHAVGPRYSFGFAHEQLKRCWDELRVPHLDLLPLFQDLPPRRITVNALDAHPNEHAHALAATEIEKFLAVLTREKR